MPKNLRHRIVIPAPLQFTSFKVSYPARPGGSGAAEPAEPRQVREEAPVRRPFWVPPGCLLGRFLLSNTITSPAFFAGYKRGRAIYAERFPLNPV
jgi:hypothetical protein